MKQILLLLIISIALTSMAFSQNAADSSERLKEDYNRVSVVAHVRILSVRKWKPRNQRDMLVPANQYNINLVSCKVIEPLKGKIKKGRSLEVLMTADKSFRSSLYDGEKVFFLSRYYDWNNHRWVYSGLESTWRDYSEEIIGKIKRL